MINTIHPLFVHFPIALLVLSGIIALIDLLNSKFQLKKVVLWNLIAGTLGAVITVISGFRDSSIIPHNETIHEIMEVHEMMAIIVFILSVILSSWLLVRRINMKKIENIFFVIILWIVMAIVGYTAFLGGKMVYDNGAGIKPMQELLLMEHNNIEIDKVNLHENKNIHEQDSVFEQDSVVIDENSHEHDEHNHEH